MKLSVLFLSALAVSSAPLLRANAQTCTPCSFDMCQPAVTVQLPDGSTSSCTDLTLGVRVLIGNANPTEECESTVNSFLCKAASSAPNCGNELYDGYAGECEAAVNCLNPQGQALAQQNNLCDAMSALIRGGNTTQIIDFETQPGGPPAGPVPDPDEDTTPSEDECVACEFNSCAPVITARIPNSANACSDLTGAIDVMNNNVLPDQNCKDTVQSFICESAVAAPACGNPLPDDFGAKCTGAISCLTPSGRAEATAIQLCDRLANSIRGSNATVTPGPDPVPVPTTDNTTPAPTDNTDNDDDDGTTVVPPPPTGQPIGEGTGPDTGATVVTSPEPSAPDNNNAQPSPPGSTIDKDGTNPTPTPQQPGEAQPGAGDGPNQATPINVDNDTSGAATIGMSSVGMMATAIITWLLA